jgi:hypothetical protein
MRTDYKTFELSVTSGFDAQTAVERELVLRLASLLWRLRRATAIETGLLQIQSEILRERRQVGGAQPTPQDRSLIFQFGGGPASIQPQRKWDDRRGDYEPPLHQHRDDPGCAAGSLQSTNAEIGRCFLRLANLDNGAFDRLSRYETALWRQVGQVLFTLDVLRRTP